MTPVRGLGGEFGVEGYEILPLSNITRQVPAGWNGDGFLIEIDHESVASAQVFVLFPERPDDLLSAAPFGMRLPAAVSANLVQPHSPPESLGVDDLVAA